MERGRTGNLAPIADATRATPPTTECDPPRTPYEVQGGFRIIAKRICVRALLARLGVQSSHGSSDPCSIPSLSSLTLRCLTADGPRFIGETRRDSKRFVFREANRNKGGRANRHTFPKVALPPQRVLWNTKKRRLPMGKSRRL